MKSCRHQSFRWVQDEDLGDRTVKHYRCRACGHPKKRNVKKPRYVASEKPLTRKAPPVPKLRKTLQNGTVGKRKAIRAVSDKRKVWLKQYEAKKKSDGDEVTIWNLFDPKYQRPFLAKTKDLKSRWKAEPHHPLGRVGCRVLFYVWVTPDLHRFIHDNAEQARDRGWILPEMSGRESGPDQPDPFGILPEYRAYVAEHGLR